LVAVIAAAWSLAAKAAALATSSSVAARPSSAAPRRGARGQEQRAHGGMDRRLEVGQRHLRQRRALHVAVGDHVDRDVERPRARGPRIRVGVDRRLVERVHHRVSARPPAARMSAATASSGLCVRPARCTVAPSCANRRATAEPIAPAPP
jgi:hypothetical protein